MGEFAKSAGLKTFVWDGGNAWRPGRAATGHTGLVGFNKIDKLGTDQTNTLSGLGQGDKVSLTVQGKVYEGRVVKANGVNEHGEFTFELSDIEIPHSVHDGLFEFRLFVQDEISNVL